MIAQLRTLVRHRLLIRSLVGRELKARYRGSVLGFLWSFINPLLLLLTYGLVFTYVFQSSLAEASGVLIAGGNLIKKVLFPAEVLPVVTVFSNLVHMLFAFPVLVFFLVWERRLGWSALLLPLPILVQLVFTLGLALVFSALTVHFRDLKDILTHLLHLWFWGSPVLYSYGDVQGRFRTVLRLNPLSHVLVSYQQMLFDGWFDHWRGLAATGVVSVLVFLLGMFLFERLRDTLAEEV
jgi:lipopolysaccharide transport system permease protein